jgi:hypothetical protein
VIAVLGVLASIVIFAVGGIAAKSAVATCNADAASVETAVQAYDVQTGGSPTVTPSLLTNSASPYLQSFPSSTSFSISIDSSGNVYVAAPVGATPISFGTPNACESAGGASADSTTTTTVGEGTTTTVATPTTTTTTQTTTTTVPTTTMVPSNFVTVVATSNDSNNFSGNENLLITNIDSITSLSVTIQVVQSNGLRESNMTNDFPVALNQSHRTSRGTVTYMWTWSMTSLSDAAR